MQKIIFIVVSASVHEKTKGNCQEFVSTPELDKLVEEGWSIAGIENITPPQSISKSTIRVLLDK